MNAPRSKYNLSNYLIILLWFGFVGRSALSAEIVRVKVPASKVSSYFPKGTELVSLPINEFDVLSRSANGAKSIANPSPETPLILRASHRATWQDGILQGDTTLDVRRGSKPGAIALEPWNVLLDAADGKDFQIRTSENSVISLWLPTEGASQVTYRWRAVARAGSDGMSFAIELPRVGVSQLEIDIPDKLVAERFVRRPVTDQAVAGRSQWSLAPAGGRVDIHLRPSSDVGTLHSLPWVSGPTIVDVTPLSANWRCEWTVDLNGGHGPLTLAFSPGLEPLKVTGPGVTSFVAGKLPQGDATLTIQFERDLAAATTIVVRGVSPLHVDRPWIVPAARPVDGVWTGGSTTVHLDRSHILESCRLIQGRRLSPPGTAAADTFRLLFEPERPAPPAELTFLKSSPLSRADVRGVVHSSQGQTRLTARVRWTLARSEIRPIAFDISRDWSVESITQEGEPLTWHDVALDQTTTRIHMITPPRGGGDEERFEVQVEAIRKSPPGQDNVELPRIRPASCPVVDELWMASADGGRILVPRTVVGLAWVDPAIVRTNNFHPEIVASDLDHALSWRFVADNARLTVAITDPPRETKSQIDGTALLTKNRLALRWTLTIQPGSKPAEIIPVFFTVAPTSTPEWIMIDETKSGHHVNARSLSVTERLDAGFPSEGGMALGLVVPAEQVAANPATQRLLVFQATSEDTWAGPEFVPLLCLGASFHARATLAVNVVDQLLPMIETKGLEVVEPLPEKPSEGGRAGRLAIRPTHRFNYQSTDVALKLALAPIEAVSPSFFVRTATLHSLVSGNGAATHRLALALLAKDSVDSPLSLRFPEGCRLIRTLVNGKMVIPSVSDLHVLLPLSKNNNTTTHNIIIEYEVTLGKRLGVGRSITPILPQLEAACHSFQWQISLPARWKISRHGDAVLQDGLDVPISIGSLFTTNGLTGLLGDSLADPKSIQQLQDLLAVELATPPASPTLAAWLGRIEEKGSPVLIDAPAFARAELSASAVLAFRGETSWTERRGPTRFERGSITVIPFDTALIVTTADSSFVRKLIDASQIARFRAEIRGVLDEGADPTGMLRHAHDWRLDDDVASAIELQTDGHEFVLRGNGWPGDDFWFEIQPVYHDVWLSAIVAVVIAFCGIMIRFYRATWLARVTAGAIAIAIGLVGLDHYVPSWLIAGFWMGAIGLALAIRPRPRLRSNGSVSATRQGSSVRSIRPSSIRSVSPIALLAVLATATPLAGQAVAAPGDVILVLLPYDGPARTDATSTHVILRLADLERLKSLATPPVVLSPSRVDALEATHQCRLGDARAVSITSEYTIITSGDSPVEWRLRSEGAWNLRATLDGREQPLRVIEDGNAAVVRITQPGRHRLVFERMVRLQEEADVERLAIALNPVAITHLNVTKTSAYPFVEIDYPLIRSPLVSSEASADLGLTKMLGVSFRSRPEATRPREVFTALALWDARVAGDLVRFRLSPSGPSPVSRLRIALDPGTQVRLNQGARLADQRWEGTPEKPEWVATFDPPFRRPEEILVDLWKRLDPGKTEPTVERQSPIVSLAGNAVFSGLIAFRRPGDWTGRLASGNEFEPIDEESFVKAWGVLPNEPFTLSGATAFGQVASVSVATAAIPPRFSTRPSLRLELGEGRVELSLDAELARLRGTPTDFDMIVPEQFLVESFSVDGLASLSRPEPGRIHVELHPAESETRKLTLRGHLKVSADNPMTEARKYRMITPWLGWRGIDEQPGQLILSASVRPQLTAGTGVSQVSMADSPTTNASSPTYRGVFQVEHPANLGEIVWQAASPNVKVRLLSRLTISDESSLLNSSIRYSVSGGPIDVLYLKVPTAWAADFQIELLGESTQRIAETRGEWTLWTLRPDRPIWGLARLAVRNTRANTPGTAVAFPDLIPLGHGSVDRILAVERQTSTPIEIEGSSGLQTVDLSRITDIDLFGINLDRIESYRVRGDSWGLSLLVRGERGEKSSLAEPQVRETSHHITMSKTGETWGKARFQIDARRGSLFRFEMTNPEELLGATIDGRLATAFREGPGRWCVPINDAGDVSVELYWHNVRSGGKTANTRIDYPQTSADDSPMLFQVSADVRSQMRAFGGLEEIPHALWMLGGVEREAKRIVTRIGLYDRSSPVDATKLRHMLTQFANNIRAANESALRLESAKKEAEFTLNESIVLQLSRTRETVSESLAVNGLDEFSDALNLTPTINPPDTAPSALRDQIDPPGRGLFSATTYFRSTSRPARLGRHLDVVQRFDIAHAVIVPLIGITLGVASLFVSGWSTRGLRRTPRWAQGGLVFALCVLGLFCPVPALFLLCMNLAGQKQLST